MQFVHYFQPYAKALLTTKSFIAVIGCYTFGQGIPVACEKHVTAIRDLLFDTVPEYCNIYVVVCKLRVDLM